MTATVFIDSNLWVYYHSMKPDEKFAKTRDLILTNFNSIFISTQILGELYYVLVRKNMTSQANARRVIEDLTSEFRTITVDVNHVFGAIDVNIRYGCSYWDSLIIATALQSDCSILYSEDMQHDHLIEGKLRIINPLT